MLMIAVQRSKEGRRVGENGVEREAVKVFYLLAVVLRRRSRGRSRQTMIEAIGLRWDDHDEHLGFRVRVG
jgi:hypothetical protein